MFKYLKSFHLPCLILSILTTNHSEAAWSEPALVSSKSADYALGMDAKGNAMTVWNNTIGTTANDFYYNYLIKDRSWYSPLPLSNTEGRMIISPPSIAIDANSNVVIVWEEYEYRNNKNVRIVKAATHPDPSPTKWSVVDLTDKKAPGQQPQVAISPSGYAVAMWEKRELDSDSSYIIQASTLQFGGEWSAPVDVSKGGEKVKVAIDSQGNAVAVWTDNQTVKSSTLPYGGNWSLPTIISLEQTNGHDDLTLDMNPSGYAVAAWTYYGESSAVINAVTFKFGESWSKPVEVPLPSPSFFISHLDVAVGNAGNATLVWQHETLDDRPFPMPNDISIQSSFLLHKSTWTKPVRVSPEGIFCSNPKIALDQTGTAYAVWNNNKAIQIATRPFGGKWSSPTDLSSDGINTDPLIAVDPSGYAVITWLNNLGAVQAVAGTP